MKVAIALLAVCFTVFADDDKLKIKNCEYCIDLAWALRFAAHQKTPPEKVMEYRCSLYKDEYPNGTDEDVANCEKVMKVILEKKDMVKHARNLENSTV
ncbi:hypothetical protein Y032_0005g2712 [Ancylostoma ceylanicum]|uniref:Saposin B-type domain-containing protein n=1 Tax=Ancylostoma ceylanicum TaxID=53326 RepID=A0A016VSM7_9BILA|nr:hypothetical protein Y032_0005g2712 [Ancylostoma ceylanicum]